MRSSYSTPSALSRAISSSFARRVCSSRIGRGLSCTASTTREHLERIALRIGVERGHRLDEIERERVVQREVGLEVGRDAHLAPAARARGTSSTTPAATSERNSAAARRRWRAFAAALSCERFTSRITAP